MPAIQHWQTDNGARVYYVPAPELPMVDVRVVFSAGSARDNGQPGLARMTNHLLNQGAAGLSANDIADTRYVSSPVMPIRSARRRTCCALSSALT